MRILMLGWEFPPFISGGLGTACHGLTKALDDLGHEVLFVLPRPVDPTHSSHVSLIAPSEELPPSVGGEPGVSGPLPPPTGASEASTLPVSSAEDPRPPRETRTESFSVEGFPHTKFLGLDADFGSVYPGMDKVLRAFETTEGGKVTRTAIEAKRAELVALQRAGVWVPDEAFAALDAGLVGEAEDMGPRAAGSDYAGDVVGDAQRYARLAVRLCRDMSFDVIHAHDWMTYPAGLALASVTGKPLVAHIHSTEFDRSGVHVNQRIYDLERRGMHGAVRVIAVSMLTKSICTFRYGVPSDKIRVVYNGVEQGGPMRVDGEDVIRPRDKIVLFLGRITMQKGPEYFIGAAKRVLEKIENVKFLVAGDGDMARRMIELAAEMGIGHKVLFTGFLRGADVQRVFKMADCYVMPSVSEPFGIAPLEAMSHDVPTIISKQSGVSEVLTHALKVDFWDTDEMANKIVAVLRHPPLSQTLSEHGMMELRNITWHGAAKKCVQEYEAAIRMLSVTTAPRVSYRR
ncbi:MAG: glycosyltransferase [Planctomycetota bacterium]